MPRAASLLLLAVALLLPLPAAAQTVTGNLSTSRTSGAAPLAVFFDAQGTTCSGGCDSYHELHYAWNFDDAEETDDAVWAFTGKPKHLAYGPEAAHVFETPGTYTVSVVITSKTGGTDTEQVTITVTNPDTVYSGTNTICFANASPFTGCPAGATQTTTSAISTINSACTAGKRCLLKRGDTFTGTNGIDVSGTGTYYDDFGAAANPPVMRRTGDPNGFQLNAASDTRIVDIQIQGTDASQHMMVHAEHKNLNLLVLRVSNVADGGTLRGVLVDDSVLAFYGGSDDDLHNGVFVVECDFRRMNGNSIFVAARRIALLGNNFDQQAGVHGVRLPHWDRTVVSHNKIANQGTGNSILTIRSAPSSGGLADNPNCTWCGEAAQDAVISDNIFRSVDDLTLDISRINGVGQEIPPVEDVIVERNFFTIGDPIYDQGRQLSLGFADAISGLTVRNNIVYMEANQFYRALEGPGSGSAYNNTCYTPDVGGGKQIQCIKSFSNCWNNLLFAPNASGTKTVQQSCSTQSNNLLASANPFDDTTPGAQAPDEYVLDSGASAVIDSGTSTPYNPIDFYLTTRTETSTPEIGAVDEDAVPGEIPDPEDPPDPDPLEIDHFVLRNASTGASLFDPFTGSAQVADLRSPGFALQAVPGTTTPGSVKFEIVCNNGGPSGTSGTDNDSPFAMEESGGTYAQYNDFSPGYAGSCTVTATPYSLANGAGTAGEAGVVTFTVADTTPAPTPPSVPAGVSGGRISGGRYN